MEQVSLETSRPTTVRGVGRAGEGFEDGRLGRREREHDLLAIKDAMEQEVCAQPASNFYVAFFHPVGPGCTLREPAPP